MGVRRLGHAAAIRAVHRHRHHGGIVSVGIMRIGVLERPTARPNVRTLNGPVAFDVKDLERGEPIERRAHRLAASFAPRFKQRVGGERRVPHRRQTRLAIGLILADDEQFLDRPTRCDQMRMVRRITERVIHQDSVRHGGIDRAEALFAIEALGHESLGRADGAAAQGGRKIGLDALEQPVDRAEDLHARPCLMRALWPLAHSFRRRDEKLRDRDAARIGGPRLQRLQHKKRHHHRARPIGDLVEMEGKPARQEHDLDRHGRHATPGNGFVEREQEAGKNIALRGAAMGQNCFTRAAHVRRLGIVADHLERKIRLDAGAHVERACVNERPAAMIALNAPKIDGDQALEFEIGLLAAEMPEQHIFGRDCRVGLKLETPMAVLVLTGEQRFRRARDMTLQCLGRRGS